MKYRNSVWLVLALSFILGSHNGYVALWEDDDPEPKEVFPYKVSSLPEADQNRLEQGIRLKNRRELIELVEDYLS